MFFAGGVFAGVAATVFPPDQRPPLWIPLTVSIFAFLTAGSVFLRGRRLRTFSAAIIVGAFQAMLLFLSWGSSNLNRATVAGMLIVVGVVFSAWFFPTWFARAVGYSSLALFSVITAWKHPNNDGYLIILAIVSLSVILTEVFGSFKSNLEQSSLTDHLCGVWNRRGFENLLEKEIRAVDRTGEPLSVIFIDLDDFKSVNDALGHHGGDRVLREVAVGLESQVRSGDSVARLGGDEFVVLLPRTAANDANRLAERLRLAVTGCPWSFGVAEYAAGATAQQFIERSDKEMLDQKRERGGARART